LAAAGFAAGGDDSAGDFATAGVTAGGGDPVTVVVGNGVDMVRVLGGKRLFFEMKQSTT
jgi:hypothetical protein